MTEDRVQAIRERLEKVSVGTAMNPPAPCTFHGCDAPATHFFNVMMNAASSAPSRFESRCNLHGMAVPVSLPGPDIAHLLERVTALEKVADEVRAMDHARDCRGGEQQGPPGIAGREVWGICNCAKAALEEIK